MALVRTSITIDNALLDQATRLAEELDTSRSRVFALALRELLERRRNRRTLDALNDAYAEDLAADEQEFLRLASASLGRIADA
jgi:metal-responsive CopG/Arc/MetJ family transcriptional regulator